MKSFLFLFLSIVVFFGAEAQNRKPKIVGQVELSTNEEQSITIQMTDLTVEDRDDWFYPWGFSMTLYPGLNYTVEGDVVTPALNFTGLLTVDVTVNDGEDDSNKYGLQIMVNMVNDKPVITGNTSVSTDESTSISILPSYLKVTDPDDSYPNDFTLRVYPGNNYTVDGNTVTPTSGFTGTLSVSVTVHDGEIESDPYPLPIEVRPIIRVPKIIGQATLFVNEDEPLSIKLTDLTVEDRDSPYPEGFTLALLPGANYSVANGTIIPAADFNGPLTVPVTVNDGANTSEPFDLDIKVIPVNDAPRITDLESTPIVYSPSAASVAVTETLSVSDVDGDSVMFAEVGIRPEGYQRDIDKLVFTPRPGTSIHGVFDPERAVLTLLGKGSPASYANALRSVELQGMPMSGAVKKIYFQVSDGKASSDTVQRALISGESTVALDIPSGFTPNGDQANDTWKIMPLTSDEELSNAHIKVYNKAGKLVYEAVGFDAEWDGRVNGEILPADTYFYTIDLHLNSPSGYVKGLVTILR